MYLSFKCYCSFRTFYIVAMGLPSWISPSLKYFFVAGILSLFIIYSFGFIRFVFWLVCGVEESLHLLLLADCLQHLVLPRSCLEFLMNSFFFVRSSYKITLLIALSFTLFSQCNVTWSLIFLFQKEDERKTKSGTLLKTKCSAAHSGGTSWKHVWIFLCVCAGG